MVLLKIWQVYKVSVIKICIFGLTFFSYFPHNNTSDCTFRLTMPWYEHCKWSCAQKYILKCMIFLFCLWFIRMLTPCSTHNIHFREPVQHWTHIRRSRVDGSVGSCSYMTYVCFQPGSISVFPYFVCKLKAFRGCLFTFGQNAWMSHMAVCDLEDPVREMWTLRMFGLTEWWKRFSWALSQQSDDREDMVFSFFFLNDALSLICCKVCICSVTQYCLWNKVHFTVFFLICRIIALFWVFFIIIIII